MALREVVLDGEPVLTMKARPVTKFDDRLAQLLDDMAETLIEYDGYGLAAPQVGVLRRCFVALEEDEAEEREEEKEAEELHEDTEEAGDEAEEDDEFEEYEPVIVEFVNPEILETRGAVKGYEGCLSFPGKFGAIERPEWVKVRAFDRFGSEFEYEATGMMARCICHEIDHLNGVTIDDLAEYFFDPKVPHELDKTLGGRFEDEEEGAG